MSKISTPKELCKKKKKKPSVSPTQRSLKYLRDNDYVVDISEHRIPGTPRAKDLFNIFDLVALKTNEIVGVQVTSGSNVSARKHKILDSDNALYWLNAGGLIVIHGWRKLKKEGWSCREVWITNKDFSNT